MTHKRPPHRAGFTLLEILIVIGIIAFLTAISVTIVGGMLANAKLRATQATLIKVGHLLSQRMIDVQNEMRVHEEQAGDSVPEYAQGADGDTLDKMKVIGRKLFVRDHFPQRFADFYDEVDPDLTESTTHPNDPRNDPGVEWYQGSGSSHRAETESSEVLYYFLTKGTTFRPEDAAVDAFNASELRDTDGDGLQELVDAWGNPLRFYRWPTRLIRPARSTADTPTSDLIPFPIDIGVADTDPDPLDWGSSASLASLLISSVPKHAMWSFNPNPDPPVFENTQYSLGDIVVSTDASPYDYPNSRNDRIYRCVTAGTSDSSAEPDWANLVQLGDTFIDGTVTWEIQFDPLAKDGDDPLGVASATQALFREDFLHTINTYHTPLVVSAGEDGTLGLFEPTDTANYGALAQPDPANLDGLVDNVTNLNIRVGGN